MGDREAARDPEFQSFVIGRRPRLMRIRRWAGEGSVRVAVSAGMGVLPPRERIRAWGKEDAPVLADTVVEHS